MKFCRLITLVAIGAACLAAVTGCGGGKDGTPQLSACGQAQATFMKTPARNEKLVSSNLADVVAKCGVPSPQMSKDRHLLALEAQVNVEMAGVERQHAMHELCRYPLSQVRSYGPKAVALFKSDCRQ